MRLFGHTDDRDSASGAMEKPPFEPWIPKDFWPHVIFPEARSVVVIGLPIALPIIETSPSIFYHELYKNVNALLDQYTYQLALYLTKKGFPSIYVPRGGYGHISLLKDKPMAFFSHRHAAYLAGLGSFGVSNMVLTREYGPRVRFGAVFTTAELPGDRVMREQLCIRCMRCVKICPANALSRKDYPQGLADKIACAEGGTSFWPITSPRLADSASRYARSVRIESNSPEWMPLFMRRARRPSTLIRRGSMSAPLGRNEPPILDQWKREIDALGWLPIHRVFRVARSWPGNTRRSCSWSSSLLLPSSLSPASRSCTGPSGAWNVPSPSPH